MKKTVLTFAALAFGMGVAFAQTTPQQEQEPVSTEQTITYDRLSNTLEEAERRVIAVEDLPEAVQEQLVSGEFSNLTILAAAELQPVANTQSPTSGLLYEIAFTAQGDAAAAETAAADAQATAQPGLLVYFDEEGKVVSRLHKTAEEDQE
ncbi:hypothetical protein [Cesiribacter andamanensis]|uniref:Uncharacterized protein n=1 Tax=Cesiribacter andamanensis AMV16 TaxID=1279009 RepID=M7NS19_9BACT|nr:hypothetical protein [Cesiribacter andamanensis]EMR01254.1 hypothetical protein ADICEAN_03622 [Cesiribacter andamanensis AMV16]